jgi:hypothetical protein
MSARTRAIGSKSGIELAVPLGTIIETGVGTSTFKLGRWFKVRMVHNENMASLPPDETPAPSDLKFKRRLCAL